MRKVPEPLLILGSAALITALVGALVFLAAGPSSGPFAATAGPTDAVAPAVHSPGSDLTDDPLPTASASTSAASGPNADAAPSATVVPAPANAATPSTPPAGPPVARQPAAQIRTYHPASFRVASFNLLGHSHTAKGGKRPGWDAGPTRMRRSIELLDAHRIDVVGFQELQGPQLSVLTEHSRTWAVHPGSTDQAAMANSIAWRTSVFRAVDLRTVPIPYFSGNLVPMPYVLLEHLVTKQRFWIGNFHNPASTRGDASGWRADALRRQVELANQLASTTPYPVLFTGDMNDRAIYYCGLTGSTDLEAANGGSNDGVCRPPAPMQVDWIFGSSRVGFTRYVADRSEFVARTTDHPVIVATATLPQRSERIN